MIERSSYDAKREPAVAWPGAQDRRRAEHGQRPRSWRPASEDLELSDRGRVGGGDLIDIAHCASVRIATAAVQPGGGGLLVPGGRVGGRDALRSGRGRRDRRSALAAVVPVICHATECGR
jgi:hypothetical protein